MLSQNTMDSIAAMTGIKADELAKAISDEQETELELPDGRFLSKDNEAKLLDNHGKKKYDEGKSKGSKEVIESIKSTFELEGNTTDDILSNYKSKILEDAKAEPNKKLAEKDKQLEELRKSLKNKEDEIVGFQNKIQVSSRNVKGLSAMGEIREDLGFKKEEGLKLINSELEFKEDGIYKNGNLLTDEYQSPLKYEDYVSSQVNERGWKVKKIQGNGGNDGRQTVSKPKTYTEYQKYCESKGWNEGSLEAKEYLTSIQGDSFDMDN